MAVSDPRFAGLLLESMGTGVVAVDRAARVVVFSREAARLLAADRSPETCLGRPCREVLARQPSLARLLLDALSGRRPPPRTELRLEGEAEGPARRLGLSVREVRDGSEPVGAALLFRDLAPFERMEAQERLRERLASLGEMAARLAHEIRNPLAAMEVLAGLLARRLGDRFEERALVEELRGEIAALAELVDRSLGSVKPSDLARVAVDPVALLEDALSVALSRVPLRVRVERDYESGLPAVRAEPGELRSVFVNLIGNALEAMAERPAPARLALRARREASRPELVLAVSDSGPGIPPEIAERVFVPFFTTKPGGSGVGLALAQQVVLGLGGTLELESDPGRGTTVRVRLPEATA